MEQNLRAKVVVVTGAAQGIGRAIATALSARGATVLVTDIDDEGGAETIDLIKELGGVASYAHCDVTRSEDMASTMDLAVERLGGLDVLVNNAGYEGDIRPIYDYDDEDFDQVLAITCRSVYLGTKYAGRLMRSLGKGGNIINIASVAGALGLENGVAYAAAKHGVLGITRTAALDLAQDNIRVNAVCPGIIRTRMADAPVAALGGASMAALADQIHPIGRIGEPSEVADLVVWLASDRSVFCTGADFKVDGGYSAR
ncbi:MAG: SDR family oxidoreductase [Pseudomonadota bacterium]